MHSALTAIAIVCASVAVGVTTMAATTPAPAGSAVRVWEDSLVLPTYEEGPPDVNAPFDIFTSTRFNYPYTLRTTLTTNRAPRRWRTLNLENDYLRCVILPDLGGHLYNCVDKVNGRDLFYANTAIKFANVASRGAWAALGIEFNFPISHNWMTVSPVDYATTRHPDGSASVWIGNIDRVYGGQWRVELTLRPRRAVLEQRTTLYNRSASRHRFYWWTNAAVRVQDDSRILYPTRFTAAHGFASVDTWPIDARGVDLSVVRTHTTGPVSLFSHGSHEPFMAIYHPSSHSGVAHYSAPIDLPATKFWSWGSDPDGLDWRVALSDDKSAYVEVQAGLFRNQETYAFLEPQETIAFTEYWLPLRDTGGMVRATPDAALNLTRATDTAATDGVPRVTIEAAFTVTRPVVHGHVRLLDASHVLADEPLVTDPSRVVRRTFPHLPADRRYTIAITDAHGTLISHTEDTYDLVPAREITTGPQSLPQLPPASEQSEAQIVEAGRLAELDGKLLDASRTYERGLDRAPDSFSLAKAAGRLAVRLKRPDDAIDRLTRAERRVSNDPEVEYYLGEAYLMHDDLAHAKPRLILAQQRAAFRAAARFELARLDARAGALDRAAQGLADMGREFPDAVRPGQAHVAVLRHLGRAAEARRLLDQWRRVDPTNSGLRYEAVLAGTRDESLWMHLAADPDRLLDIAEDYFALGFFDDAATLLARRLPHGDDVISEPGIAAADANPLVAYYRGYARERAGQQAAAALDFDAARRMSTTYIFPNRWDTGRVLEAAIAHEARDATAQFLLGSWYLSGGRVQQALQAWHAARAIDAHIPGLHRNLGLTLLLALDKPKEAVDVFREGLDADPLNTGLYLGLDQALSLTGQPAADRADALLRYPKPEELPAVVSFRLAMALAEAGRFAEAERVFAHRFFAREEGGTNVRQVYLEVRLLRARDAASGGRCDDALRILDGLSAPVADLAFTRDGLQSFLESSRMRHEIGTIEAACGRRDAARTRWESALKTDGQFPFVDIVFAYRSARRLCELSGSADACRATVTAEWTPRLDQALAAATRHIDVVGTSFPGTIRAAQGLLLASLGRDAEARQRFREALQANDAMLSHHLARAGLATLTPTPVNGRSADAGGNAPQAQAPR